MDAATLKMLWQFLLRLKGHSPYDQIFYARAFQGERRAYARPLPTARHTDECACQHYSEQPKPETTHMAVDRRVDDWILVYLYTGAWHSNLKKERKKNKRKTSWFFYKNSCWLIEHMLQLLIILSLSVLTLLKATNKETA